MNKITIDVNPEFCYELTCAIPYAYYLHKHNLLEKVIIPKGMKPFYYFCKNVEEKYEQRNIDNFTNGVQNLPNKWLHHNAESVFGKDYGELTEEQKREVAGVLDYSKWILPDYKNHYTNDKLKFKKPMIVIANQFNVEGDWRRSKSWQPHRYFDIKCLYEMFEYLTGKGYSVLYKRPKNTEFVVDENEIRTLINHSKENIKLEANVEGIGVIDDYELTRYYDDVYLIDDIVDENSNYSYNEIQLMLFANAKGFISVSGGSGILTCYFRKPNILYCTIGRETSPHYWSKNSYYQKISNNNAIPVINKYEEIYEDGKHNYNDLFKQIKETF